ncbi:2-C-methyl-D-erythritol 4-phosphate cytidylyltransferase [Caproiciproducens faecalis]|uniref:2-C-methyl-D-erythritol 4-phosphate cytidylyltransferase n=1 Tax=Caproiciproducens faecalis TaxID=2820301 RepID=A0ABS7DQP8_9FIRM|nr:2-C-methyl-D-erythritol 4-phosphate cytidylyltransferase [Caproiciproducens faecalis]MBW7573609.1 2-C-methyl-D-erythritol 4-phosphate cytidylyltransferase [Caproiciproducens faecalis]
MGLKPHCCAVVVAAGNSTRMALGFSKQFVSLCGVPAIVHTLSAFDAAELIQCTVVVCRKEDIDQIQHEIQEYKIQKVTAITEGGTTRQQSVAAGISAAPDDAAYFAIHDGARALITPEEINVSVEDAFECGASALAVPVKDTIKIVGKNNYIVSTPERSTMWAVQTPQVFERGLYLRAMKQADKDGGDYTDDCQLVEHIGVKVHLCMGTYKNIKLTTVEDLEIAQAVLKSREVE